jgi:predicted secreted hydrolase
MKRSRMRLWVLLALGPVSAWAQGFAGLGEEAEDYAPVVRGVAVALPGDHAAHPDFRIEWWYLTANLRGSDGSDYGVQWTLFRNAVVPGADAAGDGGWESPQLWMAHAAATSAETHRAAERFARGGVGQAGVESEGGFRAWLDDWRLVSLAGPGDPLSRARMRASGEGFAFDLALQATGPFVRHGEAGFSLKSERGQASYYYSQPFYRAAGTLTLEGETIPVVGEAWMDREWSSQPMAADQTGWDWFSLAFEDGARAMLYRFRQEGGDAFAGTWIEPDGTSAAIPEAGVAMEPTAWAEAAGTETPVRWRIALPGRGVEIETRPLNPQAWNALSIPYWEGPVFFDGTHRGRGYLEMTGY